MRWREERGQCRGILLMSWILAFEVLEGRVESSNLWIFLRMHGGWDEEKIGCLLMSGQDVMLSHARLFIRGKT